MKLRVIDGILFYFGTTSRLLGFSVSGAARRCQARRIADARFGRAGVDP